MNKCVFDGPTRCNMSLLDGEGTSESENLNTAHTLHIRQVEGFCWLEAAARSHRSKDVASIKPSEKSPMRFVGGCEGQSSGGLQPLPVINDAHVPW